MSDSESSDDGVEFKPSIDVSQLPVCIQNRVKALKNLQLETVKVIPDIYYRNRLRKAEKKEGCTGYPASQLSDLFLVSGIRPEIRFHLPDIT